MEGGPPKAEPCKGGGDSCPQSPPTAVEAARGWDGAAEVAGPLSQAGATARDARAGSSDHLASGPCCKPCTDALRQQLGW